MDHSSPPARHGLFVGRTIGPRRLGWIVGAGILLAAAVLAVTLRPDRLARVAAGLAAHSLCSAVFVQGIEPSAADREMVRPLLGFAWRLIDDRIDRERRSVTASFAGVLSARADFTAGYGCRLDYSSNEPPPPPLAPGAATPVDGFAPPHLVEATDPAIGEALDRLFTQRPGEPIKDVKAVVVVSNGRVIAERYAPGFDIHTPVLSWSVAKSLTNAILGVLVRQGRLAIDQPVHAPEWRTPGDPRGAITIEQMLRMESGLDAGETGSGLDPVSRMEFSQSDMAGFAAQHPLKAPPGSTWEYTSANTLILDRLLGQTVGGGAMGMRTFARRELFDPLHMTDVTMEFDGNGIFVGSSFAFASARDFARFGALYANDGLAPDGSRILPEGWVAWSHRSTHGAPYGAGFWTNDGESRYAQWRIAHGFPKDGFFASGIQGQRIYIVPSKHLVIARFGYSQGPDFGLEDDVFLIAAAIRSTDGGNG
ncbi:serine hydrolase [Methylocapsa sp. S129]|uniref:serine hydrolase domain-containing protein n=1 Tax=Methylocapsa sp. S129 TaxID=1641869 RepID=UPI00131BD9A9|nr:serine hydrolase [Methylocapsa sp. S129]